MVVLKDKQWLQKLKPEIPTAFPVNQGIRIEEAAGADDIKVKIFSNRVGNNSVFFFRPKNALRTGAELWELLRRRQHWELSEESFWGGLHQAGDRPEELQDQQDKGINFWVLSLWPPSLRLFLKLSWLSITAVTLSSRPSFPAWSSSHPSWRARLPWRPVPKNGGFLDTV